MGKIPLSSLVKQASKFYPAAFLGTVGWGGNEAPLPPQRLHQLAKAKQMNMNSSLAVTMVSPREARSCRSQVLGCWEEAPLRNADCSLTSCACNHLAQLIRGAPAELQIHPCARLSVAVRSLRSLTLKMPMLANVFATFFCLFDFFCYHQRAPKAEHASHLLLLDFNRHQSSDIIYCRNSP